MAYSMSIRDMLFVILKGFDYLLKWDRKPNHLILREPVVTHALVVISTFINIVVNREQ